MNRLFLYSFPTGEISVVIGSRTSARRVYLTPEQADQLAFKLMSLAKGGDTNGRMIELGKDFGK